MLKSNIKFIFFRKELIVLFIYTYSFNDLFIDYKASSWLSISHILLIFDWIFFHKVVSFRLIKLFHIIDYRFYYKTLLKKARRYIVFLDECLAEDQWSKKVEQF